MKGRASHPRPQREPGSSTRASLLNGQIVASFGRRYLVELADGATLDCVTRGRRGALACGDRVTVA
ncbi:MAG: ribosome small subunit-dependent GTPase A, partial [Longimicrobiales bacterium]